ncbi:MAG: hypothetical protein LBH44_08610 [Treponema sp.]|jgi:hypothetical protein|nr:hypothetical protein [Treponema sp.]
MKKTISFETIQKIVGFIAIAAIIGILMASCAMLDGLFKPEPTCAELGEHQWEKNGQKRYSFPVDANHQVIMNRHNEICWRCGIEKPDSRAAHKGNPCSICGYDSTPPSQGNDPFAKCFAAGTQILMADSSLKNIESIKEGDLVKTYAFETNELVVSKVTKLVSVEHSNLVKLTFAGAETSGGQWQMITVSRAFTGSNEIVTTADHPFWIERGVWAAVDAEKANKLYFQKTKVEELNIGDKVFMPQRNIFTEIVDMEIIAARQMTYTIELSANDNFIANGMLVKTEDVK